MARLVLTDHDHRLTHAAGTGAAQRRLDLARLDAEAADLHLPVQPAQELQLPVGGQARPVPGAVQPGPGRAEGVGDEAGGGQSRPAQVAAGHRVTADEQLAVRTGRYGTQRRVEDVHPGVRQGTADRRGAPAGGQRPGPGGDDGGLGRAIGVDHAPAGCPAVHERRGAGLGAHDQRAQMAGGALRGVGQGGERGRRDERVADEVLVQDRGEFVAQPGAVRRYDERGTGQDGDAQLQHGGVEARRGELEHAVAGAHRVPFGGGSGEAAEAAVGDRHTLGGAGGTGGVDDVGGVVGVDTRSGRRTVPGVQQFTDPARVVQGDGGSGVGEHQRAALGGVGGVHGQEGGTGPGDGQLGRDQLHRTRQDEGHDPVGPCSPPGQVYGQPVGAGGQFTVGPGPPAVGEGRRVRGPGHPGGEQLAERRMRRSRVPLRRAVGGAGLRRQGGRRCGLVVQVRHG
ncbi:hypothetical protein GCM10009787_13990 [Streptomyces bangladeshensis]|uniref:Uncharacterized protein n=1 Tax=Streptomyces bangladeshensis TaxID=295352 RepID=A0ABP5N955_9ACTN